MSRDMLIVVLHSGGLDSTTILAKYHPTDAVSLSIDYGQPHRVELEYARAFCQARGYRHEELTVTIPSGGLLAADADPNGDPVVPGRNAILLSLACSYAESIDAAVVMFGANADDAELFPDCRPEFVEAFDRLSRVNGGPHVRAPLLRMRKKDILWLAETRHVRRDQWWTCYHPDEDGKPCCGCVACLALENGTTP